MTILAEDPAFQINGYILRGWVEVPVEPLAPGPAGYRVQVVDYDSSTNRMYRPHRNTSEGDPFERAADETLLNDPRFHQQNVYAIAMATLRRFEQALGRRVAWNFPRGSHQLTIVPHAFVDANAYYSPLDEAVFFGYFRGVWSKKPVFTCLSHSIVAHELTHALLDGLLPQYMSPRSPDQFAFHEGFADIVAVLSILSAYGTRVLDFGFSVWGRGSNSRSWNNLIHRHSLTVDSLRRLLGMGLGRQVGAELEGYRGQPLRSSANLSPSRDYLTDPDFTEPHRRGEVLVAAMLYAFLYLWSRRTHALGETKRNSLDRNRVVDVGRDAAEQLLLASIRALDYIPPVQVRFEDFLSGLITADLEVHPSNNELRQVVRDAFAAYGIVPASKTTTPARGVWSTEETALSYAALHFDAMQVDAVEMFRFLWQNRHALKLADTRTYVPSVRPVQRVSEDGFVLRETVANYIQVLDLKGSELRLIGLRRPQGMDLNQKIRLYGGGSLVFDAYGRLRYHVKNPVFGAHQQASLEFLWKRGALDGGLNLAAFHRNRSDTVTAEEKANEQW